MKPVFRIFLVFLALTLSGTQCDDCPDPTNPDCDNYNPCYPNPCEEEGKGTVTVHKVYSAGLENNLLGDNPEREVAVYLPAGYEENTTRNYPVIFLLHGYGCHHTVWIGGIEGEFELDIKKTLDSLIQEKAIEPVIAVAPDSYNKFLGSKYTNSPVTGNWEDFITEDVVHFIDTHFRTLAAKESRGIAGISMGGYGALKIAMKHPDLFCAVFSLNGASLVFEQDYLITEKEALIEASRQKNFSLFSGPKVLSAIACAPAFAPNPSPLPFFGDFPLTENGDLIDSTWARWLQHDPYTLLTSHKNNLMQLRAIRFDCGTSDIFFSSNSAFSNAMSELGIDHIFLSYKGDHLNKVDERMKSEVFPFFSEYLETSNE